MRHTKISLLYGHMLCYSQDIHGTRWTWLMAQATLNFSMPLSSSGCNHPTYCILKICTKANIACIHKISRGILIVLSECCVKDKK